MTTADPHQRVRDALEDAIRALVDEYVEAVTLEDDGPENLMLVGWAVVTHWIEPEDPESNWYHLSHAAGMAPHVVSGLLARSA